MPVTTVRRSHTWLTSCPRSAQQVIIYIICSLAEHKYYPRVSWGRYQPVRDQRTVQCSAIEPVSVSVDTGSSLILDCMLPACVVRLLARYRRRQKKEPLSVPTYVDLTDLWSDANVLTHIYSMEHNAMESINNLGTTHLPLTRARGIGKCKRDDDDKTLSDWMLSRM